MKLDMLFKKTISLAYPDYEIMRKARRILFKRKNSFLYTSGWIKSLAMRHPANMQGDILPFMNMAIIHFLDSRLANVMRVFEYGSGFSTIYFSKRVKSVESVEYNRGWYEKIAPKLPHNAHVQFESVEPDGAYCRAISQTGGFFDLVLIDGRDRVNCCRQALPYLQPSGVIILDDSQRPRYSEAFALLKDAGFKALDFVGIKPGGGELEHATVFYRQDNCMGI